MGIEITFYGAARQVTGSMYHIRTETGFEILVDCGLDYEKNSDFARNSHFPFDPSRIQAVVLTHAHIDHSGNLPTLFAKGFSGSVFCTEPTAALADILLQDSARIQADKQSKKYSRRNKRRRLEPRLYGYKHVFETIENTITLSFNRPFKLNDELELELIPAGHILGAASVVLSFRSNGKTKRIAFSGDLGRANNSILGAPEIPDHLDYLVVEGTYGSREHQDTGKAEDILKEEVERTCIEEGGRLIIPAFSVGRTQSILFTLHQMFRNGVLPSVRVFADSPLGLNSGEIHQKYAEYLNDKAQEYAAEYGNLFQFKQLYLVEDEEDEELLKDHSKAAILVSSAGMMEGGRIQKHIADNIENPKSTILIAGYCTEGTLGHKLMQGDRQIRIRGRQYAVMAKISKTDIFSAHPGKSELLNYIRSVSKKGTLDKIFLTHGQEESLQELKSDLTMLGAEVSIPSRGESVSM